MSRQGRNDWRVPNRNELASIVESRCHSPAINGEVFPATPLEWFWTSFSAQRTSGASLGRNVRRWPGTVGPDQWASMRSVWLEAAETSFGSQRNAFGSLRPYWS